MLFQALYIWRCDTNTCIVFIKEYRAKIVTHAVASTDASVHERSSKLLHRLKDVYVESTTDIITVSLTDGMRLFRWN